MIDEQVKKGLECCSDRGITCKDCPYVRENCCSEILAKDALALINRLEEENTRLKQNYEDLYNIKRKLEDELIERGFAEYAHGDFRILSDEEKEQIRKETAEDILTRIADIATEDHVAIRRYTWFKEFAEKYGVEEEHKTDSARHSNGADNELLLRDFFKKAERK